MMVILNFVVLTTNIRGGLRRTHGFSSETIKQVCMFFFYFYLSCTRSQQIKSNVGFGERGNLKYPRTNLSQQSREPTNSTRLVIYLKIHDVVHL